MPARLAQGQAPGALQAAAGILEAHKARDDRGRYPTEALGRLAGRLQQAVRASPANLAADMALVETLFGLNQRDLAVQGARQLLAVLDRDRMQVT